MISSMESRVSSGSSVLQKLVTTACAPLASRRFAIADVERHRLFAEDMLPPGGRGERIRAMADNRCRDVDRVDLGIVQETLDGVVRALSSVSPSKRLSGSAIPAGDGDQVAVRRL